MDDYIQQLLKEAGIPEGMDPEVKAQLVSDLTSRASDLVNRKLIDSLSEENATAFNNLLDEKPDDADAIQKFIIEHVPDRDKIVGQALLEFRALYLGANA